MAANLDFERILLYLDDGDQELCTTKGWPVVGSPPNAKVKLALQLEPNSLEYQSTASTVRNTSRRGVRNIWRVQNPRLYRKYENNKEDYMRMYGKCEVKELFHGTKLRFVESILRENLDTRYVGLKGSRYGKGVNFSRDCYYASHMCDLSGTKYILLCNVLVANMVEVKVGEVQEKPPLLPWDRTRRFDTTTKNMQKEDVVVKFSKHEFYPKYVISF